MIKKVGKEKTRARSQVTSLLSQAKTRLNFANRYAKIADLILKKYRLKRTSTDKILICKKCSSYLVPGKSLRVRNSNKHLVRTCLNCNHVYRIEYK